MLTYTVAWGTLYFLSVVEGIDVWICCFSACYFGTNFRLLPNLYFGGRLSGGKKKFAVYCSINN